jgi:hypothetical protein
MCAHVVLLLLLYVEDATAVSLHFNATHSSLQHAAQLINDWGALLVDDVRVSSCHQPQCLAHHQLKHVLLAYTGLLTVLHHQHHTHVAISVYFASCACSLPVSHFCQQSRVPCLALPTCDYTEFYECDAPQHSLHA